MKRRTEIIPHSEDRGTRFHRSSSTNPIARSRRVDERGGASRLHIGQRPGKDSALGPASMGQNQADATDRALDRFARRQRRFPRTSL